MYTFPKRIYILPHNKRIDILFCNKRIYGLVMKNMRRQFITRVTRPDSNNISSTFYTHKKIIKMSDEIQNLF